MPIFGFFQGDPWCLPTQNWLKNATNDISIHEFHNATRHYVKDIFRIPNKNNDRYRLIHLALLVESKQCTDPKETQFCKFDVTGSLLYRYR